MTPFIRLLITAALTGALFGGLWAAFYHFALWWLGRSQPK